MLRNHLHTKVHLRKYAYIVFFLNENVQVCEGRTGHTEAVKVIYDKRKVSYQSLCDLFWESHDPTKKEYLVIAVHLLMFFTSQLMHFC